MAGSVVSSTILQDVLNFCDVTWTDQALENKYSAMILSGIAYIDKKLGIPADYEKPGEPRTILFEYVRYMRDGALDVFENNYLSRIIGMQNRRKVDLYAQKAFSTEQ